MSEPEDLEARVSDLEGEVADLNSRVRRSEQDAAAARVLAGGADRDVADLGGEIREFRTEVRGEFAAVRAEFRGEFAAVRGEFRGEFAAVRAEFRGEFAAVRGEMQDFRDQNNRVLNAMREDHLELRERVETGFAQVDANFAGVRSRLDAAAAGQQQIVGLLTTLIERRDD